MFNRGLLEATGVLVDLGSGKSFAKVCGTWFYLMPSNAVGGTGIGWCLFKATEEQQEAINEYLHKVAQQETDAPDI